MKRLMMLFIGALLIAGDVQAGEPTVVALKTKVHGLPPNVRIVVEMQAKYAVIDLSKLLGRKRANGAAQPEELYTLVSPDVFRWEFTTDAHGKAPAKAFRFRFPKALEAPPEGLDTCLTFPTKYRIVCPEGVCRSRESSGEFGCRFEEAPVIQRCLEIYQGQGVGIGVNKDCGGFKGKQYRSFPSR